MACSKRSAAAGRSPFNCRSRANSKRRSAGRSPEDRDRRGGIQSSSLRGLTHERPARFVLEEAHGIDSTRFQLVTNHLDTKRDQRRAASEYRFSWTSEAYSVVDARSACG